MTRKRRRRTLIIDWWEGWGLGGRKARRSRHWGTLSENYDRANQIHFGRGRRSRRRTVKWF